MARQAIRHLAEKALIKPCGDQSASFKLYTTAVEKVIKPEAVAEGKATVTKAAKAKKWFIIF